ncbi:hypothetical protein ABEG17_12500 [Pedococcus sp. KACC 23699]|uniref:Glycosyltransferase RgtA/B/C/D-like domain-containing protein n=1 Tax=Pedococcus sp. KACC 23699 TaxID=3149228 RepID=A0AAU7JPT5_9MICO
MTVSATVRTLTVKVGMTYLALRAVSALLLVLASRDQVVMPDWTGPTVEPIDMTVLWDGSWYRHVAEVGYPTHLPVDPGSGRVAQNAWAFYPLFPLLSRMLMAVTGLGFPVVASTLALVAGLGAAIIMARLLAEKVGDRVALGAVAVWAAFPAAVSLQLAYTESLAMLVLCGLLWALVRRSWGMVAGLSLLLGLTRPIAVPVVGVVAVAVYLLWRRRRQQSVTRGELLAALAALGVSAVGAVLWPLAAWQVTGSRTAYTDTMAAWRAGGQITPLKPWFGMSQWAFRDFDGAAVYGPVGLAVLVTTLVVLTCGPWATRLGPELRAWCLIYPAYLAVVLDPFTSIFRYALPLFPLLVVILGGGWLERTARYLTVRVGFLVAAGMVGQVAWIWKLLVFHPPSDYPP